MLPDENGADANGAVRKPSRLFFKKVGEINLVTIFERRF